jgi:SP family myo-inositol transporter-like MFS transporter 13
MSVGLDTSLTSRFTAGAVIIAASYSVGQIIVGRLVLGVGVGGAAVIAPL